MNQQEINTDEIKRLINELTDALHSIENTEVEIKEKQFICEETLDKLRRLNVDPEIVRKIMKRADELKGKTENFRTSQALYETISKIKQ